MRPLTAGWNYPTGPVREIRQYGEGVGIVSHYVPDTLSPYGYRLTGNGFLPDAPVALILSDSHGIAESVPDQATMSSIVERISRARGEPLNVLMYGWYQAAAPTYIAVADEIVHKWNPRWVVVMLNHSDLTEEPIYGLGDGWYWQMKIKPDLSIELVDQRPATPTGTLESIRQLVGRSHLALALRRRTVVFARAERPQPKGSINQVTEVSDSSPGTAPTTLSPKEQLALVPQASVRALKQAYGSRLFVVYAPNCHATGNEEPDEPEKKLFLACHDEGVVCVSAREAMLEVRERTGQLYRGFSNTAPGIGHLNEIGHQIMADQIWRVVSTDEKDARR